MTYASILKKFIILIRALQPPYNHPSLEKLQDLLHENGFTNVGRRTLQRDFQALRDELGINICYSSQYKGYYLSQEEDEDLADAELAIRLLELADNVSDVLASLKDMKEARQYVFFDHHQSFRGSHNLSTIIKAIKTKRMLSFSYQAYQQQQLSNRRVIPHLVFEFRNRWYLLAREAESEQIKTFGLDRMNTLTVDREFTPVDDIDFQEYFRHTFGVTCLQQPPEKVVLTFHSSQAPYLKALPLHHSQAIIEDTEEAFTISLKLIINYELKQEILGYGARVKVLEPESLRREILQEHQRAAARYAPEKIY